MPMAQLQYIKPCWQWIGATKILVFPDGRSDKVATVIGVSSFVADGYCMMLSCLFHKKLTHLRVYRDPGIRVSKNLFHN